MALHRFGIVLTAVALSLAAVGCEDSCPSCTGSSTQVRGFVRDANGIGLEGETVHVLGKPPVLTGSDGSFVFNDVATPYDLVHEAVPRDPIHNDAIRVWRGMTQRDPIIRGYTGIFAGPVDGALVSGDAPALPERRTKVFFLAPDAFVTSTVVGDAGNYSLHVGWLADGRSRSGKLFLLRFLQDPSTQRVLEYDGFAAQSLEAQPGGVYYVDFSSIRDPLNRSIAGTVAVPTGYEAISANFWMEAQQQLAQLDYARLDGVDFTFVAPTLPEATYRVGVDALSTVGPWRRVFTARGGLQSSDRADIVLRPAPEPLVPQQDQVIGRTTPFSWRDDGSPVLHIIQIHSTRTYVIHVVGTETRLDDLPGPGIDFGSWEIYRIDGQNVVDPSLSSSGRSSDGESFATSESVRFGVASEIASPP